MIVGIDNAMTPACGRLTVTGNLNITGATLDMAVNRSVDGVHIVAQYGGALTGRFAVTNGLAEWGATVDYAFEGKQIAVIVLPPSAVLIVR